MTASRYRYPLSIANSHVLKVISWVGRPANNRADGIATSQPAIETSAINCLGQLRRQTVREQHRGQVEKESGR